MTPSTKWSSARTAWRRPSWASCPPRLVPPSVVLAALLALFVPAEAQQETEPPGAGGTAALTGTVTEVSRGEALAGAMVVIPDLGVGTHTDGDGRYALDGLPAGEHEVEVRIDGRPTASQRIDLRADAVNRVDLQVRTEPVELPGLDVSVRDPIPRGKMAGFYLRREKGQGVFLTRQEIQEGNASEMSGVFRRVPGVQLLRHRKRPGVFRLRMVRAQPTFTGEGAECRPRYFLDGRPFEMGDEDVNSVFQPDELAGIEVYRGVSEIPARFNGPGAKCGVVVLWTRDPSTERGDAPGGA